jgi:hypothetical protein
MPAKKAPRPHAVIERIVNGSVLFVVMSNEKVRMTLSVVNQSLKPGDTLTNLELKEGQNRGEWICTSYEVKEAPKRPREDGDDLSPPAKRTKLEIEQSLSNIVVTVESVIKKLPPTQIGFEGSPSSKPHSATFKCYVVSSFRRESKSKKLYFQLHLLDLQPPRSSTFQNTDFVSAISWNEKFVSHIVPGSVYYFSNTSPSLFNGESTLKITQVTKIIKSVRKVPNVDFHFGSLANLRELKSPMSVNVSALVLKQMENVKSKPKYQLFDPISFLLVDIVGADLEQFLGQKVHLVDVVSIAFF